LLLLQPDEITRMASVAAIPWFRMLSMYHPSDSLSALFVELPPFASRCAYQSTMHVATNSHVVGECRSIGNRALEMDIAWHGGGE
jgi:hypothetical protein